MEKWIGGVHKCDWAGRAVAICVARGQAVRFWISSSHILTDYASSSHSKYYVFQDTGNVLFEYYGCIVSCASKDELLRS